MLHSIIMHESILSQEYFHLRGFTGLEKDFFVPFQLLIRAQAGGSLRVDIHLSHLSSRFFTGIPDAETNFYAAPIPDN